MNLRNGLFCAAAAALALAGCGDDNSNGNDAAADAPPAAKPAATATSPSVSFVKPADGATAGEQFTAKVKLANFEIDPTSVGKSPVAGKGHLHFEIDEGRYDVPANSQTGKLAAKLGVDGKYSPSLQTTLTYSKIPAGKHKLVCYLANNNHTPTGAQAETEFTVK